MVDSFVEAKEDSIALSGGKFNCCFMITSASVIAVMKISIVESACGIQSKYATTNQNVDADVQSNDGFDFIVAVQCAVAIVVVNVVIR